MRRQYRIVCCELQLYNDQLPKAASLGDQANESEIFYAAELDGLKLWYLRVRP